MRILIFLILGLILFTGAVAAQPGTPFDLQAAIDAADPGAVIEAPPGIYYGSFQVNRALHLVGITGPNGERAVLDGRGTGTVLTIRASGAIVENFVIRNSGNVIDKEDGGVLVEKATDVQLIGNRLEEVLYGVRGLEAQRLTLRDNYITGKTGLDVARRGDGIRLWQSAESMVEGNRVERVRDAVLWFSDNSTVRNNIFQFSRYGVHMMYTSNIAVADNYLYRNSVGAYLMYGADVLVQGNTFRENRGPSGYGLALKDMDEVTTLDNYMIDNRVGLFFDNTPSRVDVEQQTERNVFAYNDTGVLMMPAVQRNVLQHNTFLDNLEQVGMTGGGSRTGDQLGANHWDGNFWSDYVGYDAEPTLDGIGDLPYRAESLFESLSGRHPTLKLFHFSPVESTIDLAARAFPVIKPKPKLTDATPLMAPVLPLAAAIIEPPESRMGWLALVLLFAVAGLFWSRIKEIGSWVSGRQLLDAEAASHTATHQYAIRNTQYPAPDTRPLPATIHPSEETMITVKNLTKRYPQPGRAWWSDATVTAVDDVSFHLGRGEALALWGINGAGKTTILKCLLGLLDCEGELHLDGHDLRRDGRRARHFLGYVPQELAFHADMSVAESCRFYAQLKSVSAERIPVVLGQVGLAAQMQKAVGALSGGMKQRLALALALLADPPVLLLDEPTSNLDADTRDEFIDLLVTLRQTGKSLLFTSHHAEEVERLADQVLILKDGRIAEIRDLREGELGVAVEEGMKRRGDEAMRRRSGEGLPQRRVKSREGLDTDFQDFSDSKGAVLGV
jgi:nitrous oxidase accessory protein